MKMRMLTMIAVALLATACMQSAPTPATDVAAGDTPAEVAAAAEAEANMPDAVTDPDAPLPPPPEPSDGGAVVDGVNGIPPSSSASIAVGEPHPGAPDVVDQSCNTDADCAIKDVGSCCGYAPACVNKSSPTFPEQVKAQCARDGRMGICGFPAITGCKCTAGKCEGTGSDAGTRIQ